MRAGSAQAAHVLARARRAHLLPASRRARPEGIVYLRSPTTVPEALREVLTLACGASGRVRKHRTLYLAGRSRIHLDCVEGLGDFVEIEVVLGDGDDAEGGVREARELMARLGIDGSRLVAGAYVDLLDGALPRKRES